jgi:hypothetical protein
MSQAGEAPALVPGAVGVADVSAKATPAVAAVPLEVPAVETTFTENQRPPPAAQLLVSSSLSPRAPPSFPAVL